MKTVQNILDEMNEQQLSLAKMMLEDGASIRTSKTPDTNCPNCGAPRQGLNCEYCGTVFISDYKEKAEALNDTLIRNQVLTPNEMRGILTDLIRWQTLHSAAAQSGILYSNN